MQQTISDETVLDGEATRVDQQPTQPTRLSRLAAGDWIGASARAHGDAPCLVDGDGVAWSYAEVHAKVNRLARGLYAIGLRPTDRIAIVATDSPLHVVVVLACLKADIVYCDLNYRLRPNELANIVSVARPRALVYTERYSELAGDLAAIMPETPLLVSIDAGTSAELSIEALISAIDDASDFDAVAYGEDIVSIAFTSGTTGTPKGVLHSERMIRSMVYSGIREVRVRARTLRYNGPPLFHFAGIGATLYGIVCGAATLVLPQFDAASVLHWLQDGELNDCFLVPTMLDAIMELPGVADQPYPHLRAMIYGAAPMSPTLLRRMMDVFGCEMYNVFGAGTEAGAQSSLYPEDHIEALNGKEHLLESIGRIIPGIELRLVDANLADVQLGATGEIIVRSETIMSGYLDQPELTASVLVDGWIRTGDLARMDADGYLYLASRRTDMIIRGGENVYPVEIETVLSSHPGVQDVAVVGVPDDHWGETVVAAVVLRPGVDVPGDELVAFCAVRLATYKVPARIVLLEQLPRNATGKIQKFLVRETLTADST